MIAFLRVRSHGFFLRSSLQLHDRFFFWLLTGICRLRLARNFLSDRWSLGLVWLLSGQCSASKSRGGFISPSWKNQCVRESIFDDYTDKFASMDKLEVSLLNSSFWLRRRIWSDAGCHLPSGSVSGEYFVVLMFLLDLQLSSWGIQGQMEASARMIAAWTWRFCALCMTRQFCIQLYFFVSFSRSEAISRFALIVREFLAIQNLNRITISLVIDILVEDSVSESPFSCLGSDRVIWFKQWTFGNQSTRLLAKWNRRFNFAYDLANVDRSMFLTFSPIELLGQLALMRLLTDCLCSALISYCGFWHDIEFPVSNFTTPTCG